MKPKTSHDLPGPKPRRDRERETEKAMIEDAGESDDRDRDLVHGDGGTLGLDEPGDPSKDD